MALNGRGAIRASSTRSGKTVLRVARSGGALAARRLCRTSAQGVGRDPELDSRRAWSRGRQSGSQRHAALALSHGRRAPGDPDPDSGGWLRLIDRMRPFPSPAPPSPRHAVTLVYHVPPSTHYHHHPHPPITPNVTI